MVLNVKLPPKEWKKKLEELISKEVQDYKKIANAMPEDLSAPSYIPVLNSYENNIRHLVDIYATANALDIAGKDVDYIEDDDGALRYSSKHEKGKKIMYG